MQTKQPVKIKARKNGINQKAPKKVKSKPKSARNRNSPDRDLIDMRKGGVKSSLYVQTLNVYQKAKIAREIVPNFNSINSFVVGMFDYYCDRGAMSYNPQDYVNSLYFFSSQVFLAMSGQRLTVKKLPYGFYCFLEALKPTNIHYKTGNIYYTWLMDNFDTFALSSFASIKVPTNPFDTDIEGWPFLNTDLVPAVDNAVREASFSNLISRMYTLRPNQGQKFQMTDIIDLEEVKIITPFRNDVSVFAGVRETVGVGDGQFGGFNLALSNEVHIDFPLLAKFVGDNVTPNLERSFEASSFSSGNGFGAGRSLLSTTIKRLRNQNRVIMKPIDMGDLYVFLGSLVNAAAVRISKENLTIPPVQTDLTPLEIWILLRECVRQILGACDNQLLFDTGPTDFFQANYYGPYNSGPSMFSSQINMPFAFVENLKALSAVSFDMPTGGRLDWVPVFGVFNGDNSIFNNVQLPTWSLPGAMGTFPKVLGLPPSIRLADMYSVLDNEYIATNVPNLQNIVETWNTYLNSFQSCIEIAKFVPEVSTNSLSVLPMTRYYAAPPIVGAPGPQGEPTLAQVTRRPEPQRVQSAKDLSVPKPPPVVVNRDSAISLKRKQRQLTQIVWPIQGARLKTFVCSTSNPPFNVTLDALFNTWVWPSNFSYNIEVPSYSVDYYQSLYIESHRIESSYSRQYNNAEQVAGIDFTEYLEGVSTTWTKPAAEDSSVNSACLTELNKSGYGGFFSNVISDLVTSQLGLPPEVSEFVRNVSNFIPI